MLVDNDEFVSRLKELFAKPAEKGKGSVFVTQKRLTYQGAGEGTAGQTTDAMDVDGSTEYPCIMRATDGHKVKYSTLVHPENLISFTKAYSALLKASLTTLRKREKKKDRARSKKNTGAAAAPTLAKVEGPRRGAGRRKRMVRMRARLRVVLRTNRR